MLFSDTTRIFLPGQMIFLNLDLLLDSRIKTALGANKCRTA